METILLIVLSVVATGGVAYGFMMSRSRKELEEKVKDPNFINISEDEAIKKASLKAKTMLLEAEKDVAKVKAEAIKVSTEQRQSVQEEEKRLDEREKKLVDRAKTLDERYEDLESKERSLEQAKKDVKKHSEKITLELQKLAKMSHEEAKKMLLERTEEDLKEFVAKRIREADFEIQATSEEKSKEILIDVMQKSATDYVAESTATTIDIENEELKGKIIGKEGRNIRTFERLTGVDIIVDEAPNQVTLSCFDPIRREVAALAMQKLLKDGRVHPGSIEETIFNIKADLAKEIKRTGEKMAYDSGCNDLPQEIVKLLGRFKYRFSYGQNLIKHSMEMVNLGGQLASELGADVQFVKKACLLHDIGKVLTHEIEGKPHHHISGDVVRKYLKDERLANAVESHHGDIETTSLEAEIVKIADSISGARPGARRDSYENYVKRVKALEDIAKKYEGVEEAYAVHAGREVRVIFKPGDTSDDDVVIQAHKIAKEIEATQNYPGSVKVTAIRELRVTEEAK